MIHDPEMHGSFLALCLQPSEKTTTMGFTLLINLMLHLPFLEGEVDSEGEVNPWLGALSLIRGICILCDITKGISSF